LKSKLIWPLVLIVLAGCGYTNQITLPYNEAVTIAVPTFRNSIPPENLLTNVAGLEIDITQAVIDEMVKDGNLKVVDRDKADLVLIGDIVAYEQEPFRFSRFEEVDEFRLFITVALRLEDQRTDEVYWIEERFSGDTQYFINGPREVPEEEAAEIAIQDLADRVVNRVVEDW